MALHHWELAGSQGYFQSGHTMDGSLGPLPSQSYALGNYATPYYVPGAYVPMAPYDTARLDYERDPRLSPGWRSGGGIVNPSPEKEPAAPPSPLSAQDTWVYQQACESRRRSEHRNEHNKAVLDALKRQRAAWEERHLFESQRERLYLLDQEALQRAAVENPPAEVPVYERPQTNVGLNAGEREAVSRAEAALQFAQRTDAVNPTSGVGLGSRNGPVVHRRQSFEYMYVPGL